MKTILRTIAFAAVCAAALASCSKSEPTIPDSATNDAKKVTIDLVPSQAGTKVLLQDDYTFLWEKSGEELALFEELYSMDDHVFAFTFSNDYTVSADGRSASFEVALPTVEDYMGVVYSDVSPWFSAVTEGTAKASYAFIYPTDALVNYYAKDLIISLEIDEVQIPVEGSKVPSNDILIYGNLTGLSTRLGAADTEKAEIAYKHINSYLRLNFTDLPEALKGKESSVEVTAMFFDPESDPFSGEGEGEPDVIPVAGYFGFNPFTGEYDSDIASEYGLFFIQSILADECWFAVIPNTFEQAIMYVKLTYEESEQWVKPVMINKPFSPGKIKVFDLDFTTEDVIYNGMD